MWFLCYNNLINAEKDMAEDIDFIFSGPLYQTQKWAIHPQNGINRHKPVNVLWTSPANPETGDSFWIEWCRNERFRLKHYEQGKWHIVPDKDCKILTFQPESKEINKYVVKHDGDEALDFEAMAKDYDALYVPDETVWKYNFGLLNGWDVATCVFFKPKYTVMNDEMYTLYKEGKIGLKNNEYECKINPQFDLCPRSLPPLSFKQPVDVSVKAAAMELRQMAKKQSKRTTKGRNLASLYDKVADELGKCKSFDFLGKAYYLANHPDILEVFLRHGMDPNKRFKAYGCNFYLAEVVDKEESRKLLLQYGANPNVVLNDLLERGDGIQGSRLCIAAGADVNLSDKEGVTPLMRAWNSKHVELLLAAGANPLGKDKTGKSVQDYFDTILVYHYRLLNCRMLEEAKRNLFAQEKISSLRKKLQQKQMPKDKKVNKHSDNKGIQQFEEQKKR